uniref:Charged multivesicular body protein 4b n=1 Tax=Meloidogyne javanica TaxID=6303 RepID=A0A915MK89_MELJA
MSLFGKIFGEKTKKPEMTTPEALQNIANMEEMLIKKQEFLGKKIEESIATAKKHATTNKRAALKALKEKKIHEKKLEEIEGILNTIHHQKSSLENASLHSEVHDIMEDIAESQEVTNEITQAISNPSGLQNDIDEDELLKELEDIQEEEINEKLLDVGTIPASSVTDKLPDAPKDKPKAKAKTKEDDDMAELEAWASS